jgi:hypothetical protein
MYFAIKANEKNLPSKIMKLARKLNEISDMGLIKGHLTMPLIMRLANTTGDGIPQFVVIGYPLVTNFDDMQALKDNFDGVSEGEIKD